MFLRFSKIYFIKMVVSNFFFSFFLLSSFSLKIFFLLSNKRNESYIPYHVSYSKLSNVCFRSSFDLSGIRKPMNYIKMHSQQVMSLTSESFSKSVIDP